MQMLQQLQTLQSQACQATPPCQHPMHSQQQEQQLPEPRASQPRLQGVGTAWNQAVRRTSMHLLSESNRESPHVRQRHSMPPRHHQPPAWRSSMPAHRSGRAAPIRCRLAAPYLCSSVRQPRLPATGARQQASLSWNVHWQRGICMVHASNACGLCTQVAGCMLARAHASPGERHCHWRAGGVTAPRPRRRRIRATTSTSSRPRTTRASRRSTRARRGPRRRGCAPGSACVGICMPACALGRTRTGEGRTCVRALQRVDASLQDGMRSGGLRSTRLLWVKGPALRGQAARS